MDKNGYAHTLFVSAFAKSTFKYLTYLFIQISQLHDSPRFTHGSLNKKVDSVKELGAKI